MSSVAAFSHVSAALIIGTGAMPSWPSAASAHQEATSAATGAHLSSRRATSAEARSDRAWISRVNGVILLVQVIGQGTQPGRTGRRPGVGRARPSLPGRPGRTGVNARKGRLGQEHRRRGLHQGCRPLPGVSRGPFGGFCCFRLLVEPFYRLLGGLPPLPGQRTGPPAYRAVAVAVRIMVLQRGGQQSGQRSRLASGRASDGI